MRNYLEKLQSQTILENKIKIGTLFVLVILLFAPVFAKLIDTWSTQEDYSHGFFVLPISLYMVWQKREKLHSLALRPVWKGFPVFLLGILTYWVSFLTKFHTLTHLSMILILFGVLLFLMGWELTRELSVPVLFLLFMFPIPSSYYILITNPLKLMITKISTQMLHFIGVPVFREGNLLFLPSTQLEVAEACSGIRSLYSYLMLSCLFAFITPKRLAKMILILSTFPLAILVNIFRVTGTGILANSYGPNVAQGFFHQFTGFILFILGFIVLFSEYRLLDSKYFAEKSR